MGTICRDCGQDMAAAEGCTQTHLVDQADKVYPRSTYHFAEPWGVCHDCGAEHGKYHHHGCEVERCPKCGRQLISCDCEWKGTVA